MKLYLFILFIVGWVVWQTVLKKDAVPSSVKWYLKWFHAFAIGFLMIFCLYSFNDFLWLINYHSELIAAFHPNSGATFIRITGIIFVIAFTSGLTMVPMLERMAKRQKAALKWYFVIWPINFLSVMLTGVSSVFGKYPTWVILFFAVTFFGIFLASILFYLNGSVRDVLFEDKPKASNEQLE